MGLEDVYLFMEEVQHTAVINTPLTTSSWSMSQSQAEGTISRFKTNVCAKKEARFYVCGFFCNSLLTFLMIPVKSYLTASNA